MKIESAVESGVHSPSWDINRATNKKKGLSNGRHADRLETAFLYCPVADPFQEGWPYPVISLSSNRYNGSVKVKVDPCP